MRRPAVSTYTDNLEQQITILQMWAHKREEDMPVSAAYLNEAIHDLTKALEHAEKSN
jgi:hypothetical protein